MSQGTIQNPDFRRFAQEVVLKRDYLGWSQEDVAKRAGVSRATVANIETGYSGGSLNSGARIARVLGINVTHILFDASPLTVSADQIVREV